MSLTAFVRQTEAGRFSATMLQPLALSAEGASREEALAHLKRIAVEELSHGEIVRIEWPETNPLLKFAGIWKDNDDFDSYQASVEEYRRSANHRNES